MDNFDIFLERLNPLLENFLYSPVNNTTRSLLNSTLASSFAESKNSGEVLLPFVGMQVIGGASHFNENRVDIRWNTDFFPGPRFGRHPGDCMPLGFFGDFDLYVGAQSPFPPTLIARYGYGQMDYSTFNPALLGPGDASLYGEHFAEALHRALFINYDLGIPPEGQRDYEGGLGCW